MFSLCSTLRQQYRRVDILLIPKQHRHNNPRLQHRTERQASLSRRQTHHTEPRTETLLRTCMGLRSKDTRHQAVLISGLSNRTHGLRPISQRLPRVQLSSIPLHPRVTGAQTHPTAGGRRHLLAQVAYPELRHGILQCRSTIHAAEDVATILLRKSIRCYHEGSSLTCTLEMGYVTHVAESLQDRHQLSHSDGKEILIARLTSKHPSSVISTWELE